MKQESERIVLVEVSGGIAEFVKVPNGIEAYLVDWDGPESGACAFCDGDLELEGDVLRGMHEVCWTTYERIRQEEDPGKSDTHRCYESRTE